jgi:hypothetical protein
MHYRIMSALEDPAAGAPQGEDVLADALRAVLDHLTMIEACCLNTNCTRVVIARNMRDKIGETLGIQR